MISTTQNQMADLEAHVATRRLASIYCTAVDDGNADLMASLFVPGGTLVVYEPGAILGSTEPLRRWVGLEGFSKLIATLRQSYPRWVHFLGGHWIEVTGDSAEGETYLYATHLRNGPQGQDEEMAAIRYKDRYVRTAEGWRFKERNAFRQWTTVRPVSTGQHDLDSALHGKQKG